MKNKYKNKKIIHQGMKFDSVWEYNCYRRIMMDSRIELIDRQVKVYLTDAKILMKPDFLVREKATNKLYFIEAKGMKTTAYAIKERLWKKYGPHDLHVWMTKKSYVVEVETN